MLGAIIGGALALGGSLLSSKSQSKAADKAADTSLAVAQQNNALARENRDMLFGRADPFIQTGGGANALLNAFLGIPSAAPAMASATGVPRTLPTRQPVQRSTMNYALGGDYGTYPAFNTYSAPAASGVGAAPQPMTISPQNAQDAFRNYLANSDYGFQFEEGANDINSGYAGAGTLQSGAAMKSLEGFRQNLQSGYRNEFLDRLSGQQGVGLSALGAAAGVGTNYVNQVSANNNSAGTAAANAALAKGANNPWNSLALLGGTILGRSM